ncbi:MAG: hypothetical protein IT435_00935 [Phycisphaerales bacterium]|nr:hypothetical protein [Phycisphaerales bacterium]
MKTLLTALTVIAIANLLAILGFVGWLAGTDRLDRARIDKIRTMFAETIPAQNARESDEAAKIQAAAAAQEQAKKDARPPLTASEQLAARVEATEIDRQRAERLRREITDLQKGLVEREAQVEKHKQELEKEKAEFVRMRQEVMATESDAQFKKTLTILEGLKPAECKTTLKEVMAATPKGLDQVVSYLNAMDDRVRTKVIGEFIKEDPKLAANLLERLRVRGTEVPPPVETLANGAVGSSK